MKFKFLLLLSLLLLIIACKKDKLTTETVNSEQASTEDAYNIAGLTIPDGFDYSVTSPVNFSLTMLDSTGTAATDVLIDIIGLAEGVVQGKIYTSLSNEIGKLEIQLQIPNHFTSLIIRTSKDGKIRNHNLNLESFIVAEIVVDNENFTGNNADERGLNCYPELTGVFSLSLIHI